MTPNETVDLNRRLDALERSHRETADKLDKLIQTINTNQLELVKALGDHVTDDENRLTALESAVGTRTWLGGIAMVVGVIYEAFFGSRHGS